MSRRRPRRQSKQRAMNFMTADSIEGHEALFVGYVEEAETPEMIMKKFEAMERLAEEKKQRKANDANKKPVNDQKAEGKENDLNGDNDMQFTDEELKTLFQETSTFNATTNKLVEEEFADRDGVIDIDRLTIQFAVARGVNDLEKAAQRDFFGEPIRKARKKRAGVVAKKKKKSSKAYGVKVMTKWGISNGVNRVAMRKSVKVRNPNEPVMIRLPYLLPTSYCPVGRPLRHVRMAIEQPRPDTPYRNVAPSADTLMGDVRNYDYAALKEKYDPRVLLVNVPWLLTKPAAPELNTMETNVAARRVAADELKNIKFQEAISHGFIFVWTDKEFLDVVIDHFAQHQFTYIENLVWAQVQPSQRQSTVPYPYFSRSKAHLLMFRKADPTGPFASKEEEENARLDLRHQRTADIVMKPENSNLKEYDDKPDAVYRMVETLVPGSTFDKPRFVEIWASRPHARRGWVTLYDTFERSEQTLIKAKQQQNEAKAFIEAQKPLWLKLNKQVLKAPTIGKAPPRRAVRGVSRPANNSKRSSSVRNGEQKRTRRSSKD